MALTLSDGRYVKINFGEVRPYTTTIPYHIYKDADTRTYEKTNGTLPPFVITAGETGICPSLSLDVPLAGATALKDELAALLYAALKNDVYPDSIDA